VICALGIGGLGPTVVFSEGTRNIIKKYRVNLERAPGTRISRADVADLVLRQLIKDRYLRKMPAIAF